MATLKEAQQVDLSKFRQVDAKDSGAFPPISGLQPVYNPVLRCPIPPIYPNTPDSQRQYYIGGIAPQIRLMPPTPQTNSVGDITSIVNAIIKNSSGGSGGTGGGTVITPPTPITAMQISLITPVLNSGDNFTGILQISRSFQLLSITADSTCRVELYGNIIAQNSDLSRPIDTPPPPGTMQNLITDVVLDSDPLQYFFQNRMGANSDSPQNPILYVTVTNLDLTSDVITVVVAYVPLEA